MTDEPTARTETDPPWDMSQERAFMENLFCQRFNFFIVLFSLVVAGAASANTPLKLISLLWIGFALCFLVGLTIYRNYVKLDWIHKELHRLPSHPMAQAGVGVKQLGRRGLFRVNWIIGVVIPITCCTLLLAAAILASGGILKATGP